MLFAKYNLNVNLLSLTFFYLQSENTKKKVFNVKINNQIIH